MSVKISEFRWSHRSDRAALLVAEDQYPDKEIARQVGIAERTLERWKRHPAFRERVLEHLDAQRAALRAEGIANRQNRVEALNDRWLRMQAIIEARAQNGHVPSEEGGETGLVVHQVKGVGRGEDFQLIDLYVVDDGLLREMREHEKQAAQELGQWTEKREMSGPDGEPLVIGYRITPPDPSGSGPAD